MKRQRENQIISDNGKTLKIDISTAKYPDTVMKIDKTDYESIKAKYNGRISYQRSGNGYYPVINDNGKKIKIHRIIMQSGIVDHINRDTLDNRRCNLRKINHGDNCHNQKTQSRNISGITGVNWSKHHKKWRAAINNNGNQIILGYFAKKIEAYNARAKAEKEKYGCVLPLESGYCLREDYDFYKQQTA